MKYFDKKALKDFELVLKENKPKTIKVVDKLVTPQKTTDDSLQDYLRRCLDEEKQQNDISVITQEKLPIITENTVKNSIENLPKVTVEENLLNKKANDQDYYPNAYAFKCTLCDKNIGEKKGITLQNCLHNFCLSCLEDIILDNSTPEVQCPFNEYECEENLLDSEIKALTSEEGYNLYLDRSLTIDQLLENYHDSQFPKWLCKTCGQSNSDEKARCAFCDIAKPKSNVEKSQYEQLLTLEESELDLIESYEDFECPICFVPYGTGEGFMLRECLHVFCKGCLSDTITNSEVPQIKCPYMDNDYSCDCFLQDREIRSAITIEDYDKYLKMSLNMAEKGMKESYHCLTVDCHGWWINEEEANAVHCPVCRIQNCLNCNVSKKYILFLICNTHHYNSLLFQFLDDSY